MVTLTPFGDFIQEFEKVFAQPVKTTYPPYNIIHFKDNEEYLLEFAVAGFRKEHIEITTHNGVLTIKGELPDLELEDGGVYVHKGIASRRFVRSFTLPEYVEVLSAGVQDGILGIDLVRNVPEEKKPRQISIT